MSASAASSGGCRLPGGGKGREGKARHRRRESIRQSSAARCALLTASTGMFPGISQGRAAPREATESHSSPARGLFSAARIWQEKSCAPSPVVCPAPIFCRTQPQCMSPARAASWRLSWKRGDKLRAELLLELRQSGASTERGLPLPAYLVTTAGSHRHLL